MDIAAGLIALPYLNDGAFERTPVDMEYAPSEAQNLAARLARQSFDPDEIVVDVSGENIRIKWAFALARGRHERGKGGHRSAQNETGRYPCQYELASRH